MIPWLCRTKKCIISSYANVHTVSEMIQMNKSWLFGTMHIELFMIKNLGLYDHVLSVSSVLRVMRSVITGNLETVSCDVLLAVPLLQNYLRLVSYYHKQILISVHLMICILSYQFTIYTQPGILYTYYFWRCIIFIIPLCWLRSLSCIKYIAK